MVQDGVFERVVAETAAAVSSIRLGTQHDPETEMGPLISAAQRDRVAGFVDRARAGALFWPPVAVATAAVVVVVVLVTFLFPPVGFEASGPIDCVPRPS